MASKPTPGIEVRHARGCPVREDKSAGCRCAPSYRAWAFDRRAGTKARRTFPTLAAAKAWRADAVGDVRRGKLRAVKSATLREAADTWKAGAKGGMIRNRSGDVYKPSAVRGYEASLDQRIIPEFGARRLNEITRVDLQDFTDRLLADGLDPSTVRNIVMPLRAIYRRALARGEVAVNPTAALELPAVRGRRERVADPYEAARLLAPVPEEDAAVWATAFYAGLRLGELRALDVDHVDLATGVIRVERSWDQSAGLIAPKSRAGRRTVPIPAVLRDYLDEHKLRLGGRRGLIFGRSATTPFNPSSLTARAKRAWTATNAKLEEERKDEPRLIPIGLHEARHTYASLMIAAGVNAKALTTYMGHSSIQITYDLYGHLMPGNEDEAAALLDAYLERANTAARLAQLEGAGQSAGQ